MKAALPVAASTPALLKTTNSPIRRRVTASEFYGRLSEAAAASRQPARDLALVHVLIGTGLTPIEIASLQIAGFLNKDGTIRERASVRSEVARNAKTRPLLWTCPAVTNAMTAYLVERSLIFGACDHDEPYLGFKPQSALLLAANWVPIRVSENGRDPRKRCTGLHDRIRCLLREANLAEYSSFYARKVFAPRLHAAGASLEEIALLLGVARHERVRRMIDDVPVDEAGVDRLKFIVSRVL